MTFHMKRRITVAADAREWTGCVPAGRPHVHPGTCSEIIATHPYPHAHPLAGRCVEWSYIDADTGAYVVYDGDDEYLISPDDCLAGCS